MSKAPDAITLCRHPDTVKFIFEEGQEMHHLVTIQNLVDKIVKFKIKTNRPGIHLVKPMEGQIFNKSTISIDFVRKMLPIQNFNQIISDPSKLKEKFLIEFSCQMEDAFGTSQLIQQVGCLGVTFVKGEIKQQSLASKLFNEDNKIKNNNRSPLKKQEFEVLRLEKSNELQRLIVQRQKLQANSAGQSSKTVFTKLDLINMIVIALLAGFVII